MTENDVLLASVRCLVQDYRAPLVGGVVGYHPDNIRGISNDEAFEYALNFYDEVRRLLGEE